MTLEELLRQGKSFGQGASNSAASTVTGPVDMLAWLLRKGGVPVGDTPIGGEAWMRQKGLMATPENRLAGLLGEGAGLAAPIVAAAKAPEIAGGLLQMGRNLNAPAKINKQAGQVFIYPQEKALATAQKNAAKPFSEGGLGLHPNNTAAERAKAMGFDTDAYHATPADFNEFVNSPYRGASFLAPSGKGASSGASAGAGDAYGLRQGSDKIMPVTVRSGDIKGLSITDAEKKWFDGIPEQIPEGSVSSSMKDKPAGTYWFNWLDESQLPSGEFVYTKKNAASIPYSQAIKTNRDVYGQQPGNYAAASDERWAANNANSLGKKGFLQNDEGGLSIAVTQPNAIRSRFAAFDPARRNEADLLGRADPKLLSLLAAGGLLGTAGYNKAKAEK